MSEGYGPLDRGLLCVVCGNPESICPCPANISPARFKAETGNTAQDDDLDRCNCKLQGRIGHWHCGWNTIYNKPNFYLPMDKVEEDRRKRGIPLQTTHDQ